MLLFLLASIVLQLAVVKGLFDDCPINREQLIDNDRVFDVLNTFYKDLCFIRASTQSGEGQNSEGVVDEMRNLVPAHPPWQQMRRGLELLGLGYIHDATPIINDAIRVLPTPIFPPLASYIHYFAAEEFRTSGYIWEALISIVKATHDRRESVGISLNELERLYGLTVIQRVWNFNQDVDEVHVIGKSQRFEVLKQVHNDFKDDTDPLLEMRPAELRRIMRPNNQINVALRRREIGSFRSSRTPHQAPLTSDLDNIDLVNPLEANPVPDIFRVRSISQTSAEDILCEFARKLAILVPNSREDGGTDYSSLISQLREVDAHSAEQLETIVVPNLANENHRDVAMARIILLNNRNLSPTLPDNLFEILQIYLNYFGAELYRYTNNCEDILKAGKLVDEMKRARLTRRGITLDKMHELEGRILIRAMKCFRDRLISIYRLNGRESEKEIEEKRYQFGGWQSLFPNF